MIDKAFIEQRLRTFRKVSASIPYRPHELWLRRVALEGSRLPRGKRFDRFRRNDQIEQEELIMDHLRFLADSHLGRTVNQESGKA